MFTTGDAQEDVNEEEGDGRNRGRDAVGWGERCVRGENGLPDELSDSW